VPEPHDGTSNDSEGRWIDAEKYQLLQVATPFELFARAHGRAAESAEEVGTWALNEPTLATPIDPFAVLTDDEISELLDDVDRFDESRRRTLSD
jgi:hypothetical protein